MDQINQTVEDMISTVESRLEPNKRFIKFAFNSYCCGPTPNFTIVDMEFLKNNEKLEGAYIFKKLFGLIEDDQVFCYNLNFDQESCATILKDYCVRYEDWECFMYYLRCGHVKEETSPLGDIIENDERTSKYGRICTNVERLMQISIKFGGIPSIDEYYEGFKNRTIEYYKKKKYESYNPANPRADKYNKYIWASHSSVGTAYMTFITNHKVSDGWSVASHQSETFVWYRKLRDGTEENDIQAIYTASEVEDEHEGQIVDDMDELAYDYDYNEISGNQLEAWIDSETQETPYHSGW